ncbi:DUF721 domain-containing protein [Deinococcus radiophilus]|uniref:DUF721 domain-containing protein n=1 Tax=Deinococcus radiophilus TaxID=32062 RepID=UPI003615769C
MRSVGDLMNATLGKNGLGFGVRRAQAILIWPQAVGPEVARLTRARSFQFGTLHIEARDSAAAHHLSMQRHHFLARLNELLRAQTAPGTEPELVSEIRFGTGWAAEKPSAGGGGPLAGSVLPPLTAEDRAQAARAAQVVGEDLRGPAQQAAEAVARAQRWREQQGWTPCPVCEVPSPHTPCRPCQRLLRDPLIRRATDELLRQPEALRGLEDRLGASGEQAARFLAIEALEGQLTVLALECVQSGGAEQYREFLEQQCGKLLALLGRKSVAEVVAADYAGLPGPVRQVLMAGRAADRRR